MVTHTKLPECKCPYCQYNLSAASHHSDALPSVGDLSVCIECAQLLVFDDDLMLRIPTQKEYQKYKNHQLIKRYQDFVRKLDRRKQNETL